MNECENDKEVKQNVKNVNNKNDNHVQVQGHNEGSVNDILKICTWNVNGWKTNGNDLKKNILHLFKPDIVCLTETHLTKGRSICIDN